MTHPKEPTDEQGPWPTNRAYNWSMLMTHPMGPKVFKYMEKVKIETTCCQVEVQQFSF